MNVIHGSVLALHSYQKAMEGMDYSAIKSSAANYVSGTEASNGNSAKSENRNSPLAKPVPDMVSISPEAQARAEKEIRKQDENSKSSARQGDASNGAEASASQNDKKSDGTVLTDAEQAVVNEMKARDQEVRTHEEQHKATGGQYASSPSYTYETGPDGKKYITDGEVQISVSVEDSPDKTIAKMQQVQRAALAPQEPSGQDRKVAAEAAMKEAEARRELAEENVKKSKDATNEAQPSKIANTEEGEDENPEKNVNEAVKDLSSSHRGFAKLLKRAYSPDNAPQGAGFQAVA